MKEARKYLKLTYCSWVNRNKEPSHKEEIILLFFMHGATLPCKVRLRKAVKLATPATYRLLIEWYVNKMGVERTDCDVMWYSDSDVMVRW